MKTYLKKNLCFIIFLAIFGLVGGYFTGIYTLQSTDPTLLEDAISQLGSADVLIAITTIQSVGYALFCGIVGKIIAEKVGLWRSMKFDATATAWVVVLSLLGGLAIILPDLLFFNNFSEAIRDSYQVKPTVEYIVATLTYGGVVEEVMLRLFFMSLIAFLLMKISKRVEPTDSQLIAANFLSAMLFAAGHLPATAAMIGITPIIVFRCFLLNGGIGLLFGRTYRKYGLLYACLAHIGVHIVSKLIWILFV